MIENKTILESLERQLCTGCGTCVALCRQKAIKLVKDVQNGIYIPHVERELCNNCGICLKVCPGPGIDFDQLNLEVYGKISENILTGIYRNCYIGYATDHDIRHQSSSGGLITALLIYALEERIIDGALVTRMNKNKPLEPEPFIAKTKDEIIEASKSKYCPVPANIAIREILEAKDCKRFAVVGLPCHIQGLRKAEMINKELKTKIVLHLGLFCNHVPNFWGTKILFQKLKIKEREIIKLDYRGDGWPGCMKINLKDGTIIELADFWRFLGMYFFFPTRCLMCSDLFCELADVSFGDAWLPELSNDKIGTSIIISKNDIAENILLKLKLKEKIELCEIDVEKVIQSQVKPVYFKKKNLAASERLFKNVPVYNNVLEPDRIDKLLAVFPYVNSRMCSKSYFRRILRYVPFEILSTYNNAYDKLFLKKVKQDKKI